MNDCLFCQLAQDKTKHVWSNDVAYAVNDIHPKAPVHILVIPRVHIEKFDDLAEDKLAAQLIKAIQDVAKQAGVNGAYRLQVNNGRSAGQVIDHLHFHIMGGRQFEA